ncbi:MAG: hypothetical protein QOI27_89 [Gaiellaceae bacterium]|jgi:hypothetical protein|nr:hypothetical protein [Gaiellaceae bacterium]
MLAGALVVYAVACLLAPKGLLTGAHGTDVSYYREAGEQMAHGRLPYRDFYLEYPPGALPVLLLPAVSAAHYVFLFKLTMAACGAGALAASWVTLRRVQADTGRALLALTTIALAPLLLGSVFLNRYDAWPALVVAIALPLLLAGRQRLTGAALALGVVAKVFPLALVPLAGIELRRRFGRAGLRRGLGAFLAVGAVTTIPFAALGPGGLAFSFYIQATRHLQVESLAGSVLLVAHRVGVYDPRLAFGRPGSLDAFGTLPSVLGVLSTLVEIAAVVAAAVWYARGPATAERTICAAAAAIAAYLALGKVISPQYLVWLVPVVPLVAGRAGKRVTGLLVAALVLTQLEFLHYDSVARMGPVVWLLLARNVVLVAIVALLLRELRLSAQRGGSQTSKPSVETSR